MPASPSATPEHIKDVNTRYHDAAAEEQTAAGCVIGRDYPAPIVDHKRERERAMERYRAIAG